MAPANDLSGRWHGIHWRQCHNAPCKLKGKRVTVRRKNHCAHGFGFKFRRGPTSVCEGAPKVFRQRNSQRFIMELSKARIASASAASVSNKSSGTQELRGAEVLVKALQAEGVKYIWGYP